MSGIRMCRGALLPAAVLAILGGLAAVSWFGGPLIRKARPPEFVGEEMAYFPSGRFLGEVSAGQRELVADVLWLRALQYYGSHRQTDGQYLWAQHIFGVITSLSPHFIQASQFGALVLATDAMQPDQAFDLLKRAMHANPTRWEIPFDLGFLYYVNRHDALAAKYFDRARALPGAPEHARRFAAVALRRSGSEEGARTMWEQLRDSATNPASREIAEYSLRSMDLDAALDSIEVAAAAYRAALGFVPRSVNDLLARGDLRATPADPFGRGFLIDPASGRPQSVFRIEETLARTLSTVRQTLLLFRQKEGAFPAALDDLIARGYMTMIRLPEGFTLRYDPATGEVTPVVPPHVATLLRGVT
jgi:tetratricopeptide (TPR) repeat protein